VNEDDATPRRLHPVAMLPALAQGLPSLLVIVPAITFVRIGPAESFADGWLGWAALAAALAGILLAWLRWRSFTYAVEAGALVISDGLLTRRRREIPLERIQDISIEQKFFARPFGAVKVRVETGGHEADEGTLAWVGLAEAKRLRDALRRERGVVAAVAGQVAEEPLFAMSLGRVILFGAFNFSLVWLVALYAIYHALERFIDFDTEMMARWFGIIEREVASRFSLAALLWVLAALVVVGFLSGLVSTLLREFGFRLLYAEGRFRRVRGLLTRTEVAIVRRRVQLSLVQRWPLSGALGWSSLQFQSLGGSNDKGGRQQMAPFAREEEVARIVDAAGFPQFERAGLVPVSGKHVVRVAVRQLVPAATAILIAGWFFPPSLWLLLALPLALVLMLPGRHFHRYAMRTDSLQVMHGVVLRRDWTVPYDKVQVVAIRQSLVQRMLGVASVEVDVAGGAKGGGRPDVEDISTADAVALAQGLISRA
jgi:putative membrane protein